MDIGRLIAQCMGILFYLLMALAFFYMIKKICLSGKK